jgi:hypothetical protein
MSSDRLSVLTDHRESYVVLRPPKGRNGHFAVSQVSEQAWPYPSGAGHSYSDDGVKMLVYRKFATLARLHEENLKQRDFLRSGGKSFEEK